MFRIALVLLAALCTAPSLFAADFSMEVLHRGSQTWNGADLPAYPDGPPEVTIVKLLVQPGASLPEHLHPVINGVTWSAAS